MTKDECLHVRIGLPHHARREQSDRFGIQLHCEVRYRSIRIFDEQIIGEEDGGEGAMSSFSSVRDFPTSCYLTYY